MQRLPQYARIGTAIIVLLVIAVAAEGVSIAELNTRLVRVQHTAAIPGPEGPAGPAGPTGPQGRPGLNGLDGQAAAAPLTFDNCRFTQQVKVVTDIHRSYYPNADGTYDIVADKSYVNVCSP